MKRKWIFPLIAVVVIAVGVLATGIAVATPAPKNVKAADGQKLRILFIGSSVTNFIDKADGQNNRNNLPLVFKQLAESGNRAVEVDSRIILGRGLEDHWNDGVAVKMIKNNGPWDYVVLQDLSKPPIENTENFYKYVRLFNTEVRNVGAKPLLFENWPFLGTPADTINRLNVSFETISKELNIAVLPFGLARANAQQKHPNLNLYDDEIHTVYAGTYLNASVMYALLFKQSPVGLPSLDLGKFATISASDLQTVAWDTVQKSPFSVPVPASSR